MLELQTEGTLYSYACPDKKRVEYNTVVLAPQTLQNNALQLGTTIPQEIREGTVNGIHAYIAMDSGAEMSVVAEDLLKDYTVEEYRVEKAFKGHTASFPCTTIQVSTNDTSFALKALVVPRDLIKVDLVLGRECPGLEIQYRLNSQKTHTTIGTQM